MPCKCDAGVDVEVMGALEPRRQIQGRSKLIEINLVLLAGAQQGMGERPL